MCECLEHDSAEYTQCTLRKDNRYQTSWLPSKFAKVARVLKLRRPDGTWENGWIVVAAYGTTTGEKLEAVNRAVRKMSRLLRRDGGTL